MNGQARNLDDHRGSTPRPSRCSRRPWRSYRRLLERRPPRHRQDYNNLAMNLDAQGKHAEAQPLLREGAGDPPPLLGEDHPDTATSYNNLAPTSTPRGSTPRPSRCSRRRWRSAARLLGEDHPDTATSYNNLALNLKPRGSTPRPSRCYEKALAIRRKAARRGPPRHRHQLQQPGRQPRRPGEVRRGPAAVREGPGDPPQGARRGPPRHRRSYNNLAANLDAQGKYAEAQPLLREGAGHPPQGAGRGPPRHRHQLQQPGAQPQRPGEVRRGPAAVREGAGHPPQGCSARTTPTPPPATTTWRSTSTPRGSTPRPSRCIEKALAICRKRARRGPPRHRHRATTTWRPTSTPRGSTPRPSRCYEKALAIRRTACSARTTPTPPRGYNNLAGNLNAQGKYARGARSMAAGGEEHGCGPAPRRLHRHGTRRGRAAPRPLPWPPCWPGSVSRPRRGKRWRKTWAAACSTSWPPAGTSGSPPPSRPASAN